MDDDPRRLIPGDFEVIACDLPPFRGDWTQRDYGDPRDPRLLQLREEYRLDEVVAAGEREFDALLALRRWVRSRWDHGWSRSFETVKDALDILHEADRGEQFNCGYYSRVFVDCARALGFVARGVSIDLADCSFPRGYNVGNVGHSVVEVWSNELRKWVLFDCDLNLHYARGGVPLSALEVHDAWLAGQAECVEVAQATPHFVVPAGPCVQVLRETPQYAHFDEQHVRLLCQRFTRHQALDYYARLSIGKWEWLDPRCRPVFVMHFGPAGGKVYTSSPDDLYWSVNQVRLSAKASWEGEPRLAIGLEHCTPWFDRYEVRLDGGDWQTRPEQFDWPMQAGRNVLEVRTVNACGRPGVTSRLEVAFATAKW